MLSDVLSKALEDIKYYQEDYGRVYEDYKDVIEVIKKNIEILLEKLPPLEDFNDKVESGYFDWVEE